MEVEVCRQKKSLDWMLNGRASRETYSSIGIPWLVGVVETTIEGENQQVCIGEEEEKTKKAPRQPSRSACALSVGTSRTKYTSEDEGL